MGRADRAECAEWEGEGQAIESYFAEIGQPVPRMRKFAFSIYPNAYFVKP